MTEPVTIRWTAVEALLTALAARDELAGVQIAAGYPGDRLERESIWLDELDGEITIPASKASDATIARDDEFTIPLEIRAAGHTTHSDAMRRVHEIIAGIEAAFARDAQLGLLDGVVTATITSERATAGDIAGLGVVAFGEVVVTVLAAAR